jgi:hypothetical protein
VWAWQKTNYVSHHHKNYGAEQITLLSDGSCTFGGGKVILPGHRVSTLHGIALTLAWTVLSLVQLYTGRYGKHNWRNRHMWHSLSGILAGVLTLFGFIIMMNYVGWALEFTPIHNLAGLIGTALGMLLILGGIYLLIVMKSVNMDW